MRRALLTCFLLATMVATLWGADGGHGRRRGGGGRRKHERLTTSPPPASSSTDLPLSPAPPSPQLPSDPPSPPSPPPPEPSTPPPSTPALPSPPPACRISQFFCLSGEGCVSLDRFCDGRRDCEDKSDEPKHCSPCNRTYWGESGESYELEVRRPAEDSLPFQCTLNFTAAGGQHGDIVQITFLSFAVGTFAGWGVKGDGGGGAGAGEEVGGGGCPDGGVGVAEAGLPPTGGLWCGTAWGHSTYFSETHSVALYLTLLRLPPHQHFHFRVSYRFLKKSDATARYGEPFGSTGGPSWMALGVPAGVGDKTAAADLVHRGQLVSGTYCDRVFRDCHRLRCRIQSPNFPGMYPRNASCTYTVEAGAWVPGMHATVAVLQRAGQKVHLKEAVEGEGGDGEVGGRGGGGLGRAGGGLVAAGGGGGRGAIGGGRMASGAAIFKRRQRVLRSWAECGEGKGEGSAWRGRDALTFAEVKDGEAVDERVLLRLCGGGEEAVEAVVSSGPTLQIRFASSAFDNPFHPIPLTYLPGFELEVQIRLLPKESLSYVRWSGEEVEEQEEEEEEVEEEEEMGPGEEEDPKDVEEGAGGGGGGFFRLRPIPWPPRMRHLANLPDYRPSVRFRPDGSGGGGASWCYFLVTGGKGEVESPRHTIPPNTLCLYVFRAEDQDSAELGGPYPGGMGDAGGRRGTRRKKRSLHLNNPFSVEAPRGEGEGGESAEEEWKEEEEEGDDEEDSSVVVVEERRVWISFSKFHAAPSALGSEERLPTRRRLFAQEEEAAGGGGGGGGKLGGKRSKGGGWAGARAECMAGGMRIFDGEVGPEDAEESQLPPLLGEFCRDDAPPRLCDHSHLVLSGEENSVPQDGQPTIVEGGVGVGRDGRPRIRTPARPCRLPTESYLSSGRSITLSLRYGSGSALFPLAFRLRYEFVSVEMRPGERGLGGGRKGGGEGAEGTKGGKSNDSLPWNIAAEMEEEIPRDTEDTESAVPPPLDPGSMSCNHIFKGPKRPRPSLSREVILRRQDPPFQGRTPLHSPRSVFLFGRGGRRDVSCITRFEPRRGQRLVLELGEVRMGSGGCHSERDPFTGRWQCIKGNSPEYSFRRDPILGDWASDSSIVGILRGHAKTSIGQSDNRQHTARTGFDPGGGGFFENGFRRMGLRKVLGSERREGGRRIREDASSKAEYRVSQIRVQRSADRSEEGELWFSEFPWPGVRLRLHCLCGYVDDMVTIDSVAGSSELNFSAAGMAPWQDQRSFRYSGWMRFEEAPQRYSGCAEGRRISGPSGTLSRAEGDPCGGHPWLLEPSSAGVFLHLRIAGRAVSWSGEGWHPPPSAPAPPPYCSRGQRAFVTRPGLSGRLVLCPSSVTHVRLFSGGWPLAARWDSALTPPLASAFVFEFEEASGVVVEWLEVIPGHPEQPPPPAPASSLSAQGHPAAAPPDAAPQASSCPTLCPEIPACVSPELWCDGTPHCPSGADEALCGARGRPPAPPRPSSAAEEAGVTLYTAVAVGGGVAAMGAITLLLVAVASAARRGRRRGRKEKEARRGRGEEAVGRVGTLVERERGERREGRPEEVEEDEYEDYEGEEEEESEEEEEVVVGRRRGPREAIC